MKLEKFKNLKIKNSKNGYTLVETLVAISIFSVSILGLLITLSQGIANTGYAKRKVTGAYLAQEGVEYIRNLRDTYMIYNALGPQSGWNAFKSKLTAASCATGCYFNADNLNYTDSSQPMIDIVMTACSGGTCPPLSYNSSTGKYGYGSSGQNSGFTRKILLTEINANEVKITSTVSWRQGSGTYSVSLSDYLFSWIE